MFRIDHPTRAAALPAPDPLGSPGFFTKGDPNAAIPATRVTQDWANAVQEELANAIEGNGLTLDKGDRKQLQKALGRLAGGTVNLCLNPEGQFRGNTRAVTNTEVLTTDGPYHWWAKAGGVGDAMNFSGGSAGSDLPPSGARNLMRLNKGTDATTGVEPTLRQSIEGVQFFAGKTFVVAFDAFKVGGLDLPIVGVEVVQDFGTGGSPSADVTTQLASLVGTTTIDATPRRFVYGVTLPSIAAKTIGSGGGDHLKVRIRFGTNQLFDVRVTGFVFSGGQVDPGYQFRSEVLERAMLQRFFETSIDDRGYASFNRDTETALWDTAFAGAGVVATLGRRFRVPKYSTPTVTWYAHDATANNITEGAATKHPVTSGTTPNGPTPTHTGWPTITTPPAAGLRDFRAYWEALAEIAD